MIRLIIITFIIYGYCNASCGKPIEDPMYGIMANGERTHEGAMACPSWLPLATLIFLDGERYRCEDRGGAITGNRLDIWFPTCEEALEWGRQEIEARVITRGKR